MRALDDLLDARDPAWPGLKARLAASPWQVEVLPRVERRARATLLALQVTTHSTLGALGYETGGVLVDHGFLRLLGGGCRRMSGLRE